MKVQNKQAAYDHCYKHDDDGLPFTFANHSLGVRPPITTQSEDQGQTSKDQEQKQGQGRRPPKEVLKGLNTKTGS